MWSKNSCLSKNTCFSKLLHKKFLFCFFLLTSTTDFRWSLVLGYKFYKQIKCLSVCQLITIKMNDSVWMDLPSAQFGLWPAIDRLNSIHRWPAGPYKGSWGGMSSGMHNGCCLSFGIPQHSKSRSFSSRKWKKKYNYNNYIRKIKVKKLRKFVGRTLDN